jgi:hypothetical protein
VLSDDNGSDTFCLLAAPLSGFAARPTRCEDRCQLRLFGGFPARPLQFLRGVGFLFGLQGRSARRFSCRRRRSAFGRLPLFLRLFLGLPCGYPEIAGGNDRLPRLPPLVHLRAPRGGLGTLQLRLPCFLRGAKPVG